MSDDTRRLLTELREDMERHKGDAEYTAALEHELRTAKEKLAEAEAVIRASKRAPSFSTPSGFHNSWVGESRSSREIAQDQTHLSGPLRLEIW